jgi:hypothetical protein
MRDAATLPGDVVLYTVSGCDSWESRIVGIGQLIFGAGRGHEQFSHAAVLSHRPGWEYEAKWPRIGHFEIDQSRDYEIRRPKHYTEHQRYEVLLWFRSHEGDLYDLVCLLTFGLIQLPGAEVCSQAVDLALRFSGAHPDREGKNILSPDALGDFASEIVHIHKGRK